jgi:hypothetical protein
MVEHGKLHAIRTAHGALRILPGVTPVRAPGTDTKLTDVWIELKRLAEVLRETRRERDALKLELEELRTKLAATPRSPRQAPSLLTFARSEALASQTGHASIQSLIEVARRKSRRRLWLWRLTA